MHNLGFPKPTIYSKWDEYFDEFREEITKSVQESLGVQIKLGRNTYHRPYQSHYDFLKSIVPKSFDR
jgi:hypothetical protein